MISDESDEQHLSTFIRRTTITDKVKNLNHEIEGLVTNSQRGFIRQTIFVIFLYQTNNICHLFVPDEQYFYIFSQIFFVQKKILCNFFIQHKNNSSKAFTPADKVS